MSAILKFDFQKRKQLHFQKKKTREEKCLNYTKKDTILHVAVIIFSLKQWQTRTSSAEWRSLGPFRVGGSPTWTKMRKKIWEKTERTYRKMRKDWETVLILQLLAHPEYGPEAVDQKTQNVIIRGL